MIKLIEILVEELPSNDRVLAMNFIKERKFRSLLEIIKSDILKHKKNLKFKIEDKNFENVDIERLEYFQETVYNYHPDLLEEDLEFNPNTENEKEIN